MKFKALVLASMLAVCSLNAEDSGFKDGFHFGFGFGLNSVDGKKIGPTLKGSGLVKDTGFGMKLGLGYDKILENNIVLGVDGFFSLDKFMFDDSVAQDYHDEYASGVEYYWYYGYELAVKAGYKINEFVPYGKLAYQKISISGPDENPISDYSFSGLGFGVGFDYYTSKRFKVGFDYTAYSVKGEMKSDTSSSAPNNTFTINFARYF